MKRLMAASAVVVFAGTFLATAAGEVCEPCAKKEPLAWPGKCTRCSGATRYRESKLCRDCAEKAGQCEVCLAKTGEAKRPPKEPRPSKQSTAQSRNPKDTAESPDVSAKAPLSSAAPAKPGRHETDYGLVFIPRKPHASAATLVVMEETERAAKLMDLLGTPLEQAGMAAVCPKNADALGAILSDLEVRLLFRPGKLVLLGFSQNAGMAYKLAAARRSLFAGLAVASAWTPKLEPADLEKLAGLPVLLVHGQADRVCPLAESTRAAGLLRRAKTKLTLETLEDAGHLDTVADRAATLIDWAIAAAVEADRPLVTSQPAASQPAATPASQPTLAQQFLDAADAFELKLSYVGRQKELEPFYGLHVSVGDWKEKPGAETLAARIAADDARRIIRHLAAGGEESFFARSANVAGKTHVPDAGPAYSLSVSGPKDTVMLGYLGWGPRLMDQLAGLRGATDGTAAEQLDRVIGRLKPLAADWDKELSDKLRKQRDKDKPRH